MDIQFDASQFIEWLKRAESDAMAAARQTLGQSVALALAHARATTDFKDQTGTLRSSIVRGDKGQWRLFIKAGAKHAAYVEYGTRPHVIEARRRKALRFVRAGEIRFRRRVHHPGTKPTHFMDEAATVGARFLDWKMEENLERVFSR